MIKTIDSIDRRWVFEIYNKNENINSNTPTVFLLADKMPNGHNSKFPYFPVAGYKTNNPSLTFNSGLPFNIDKDKVILLLRHSYQDIEKQLDLAIRLLKTYYNVPYYDCENGMKI